jgi:hypothetical protein
VVLSYITALDEGFYTHLFTLWVVADKDTHSCGKAGDSFGEIDYRGEVSERGIAPLDMVIEGVGQGHFLSLALGFFPTAT